MKRSASDALPPEHVAAEIAAAVAARGALTAPELRALRREYSKRLRPFPPRSIIAIALQLNGLENFACRFIAAELLREHPGAIAALGRREVAALGRGIDSWWSVDTFGCYVAGPAWREGAIDAAEVERWARSRDRWWRRAALVATVPLNNRTQGGSGDPERTLRICAMLAADRDDMVVKALSWALRALATRRPESVRLFLAEHESTLHARVLREVRNKLNTGLKNPRPRGGE